MNESLITLQGWLGSDVTLRQAGESTVGNFRLGCTPRRYQRKSESWVDGETQWYTVNAWRALGEHCAQSLRRGDPVVVHGRVNARTYVNKASVEVTVFEIEAVFVGHDLNRGTSSFAKTPRSDRGSESTGAAADAPAEPASVPEWSAA
ncbi:MAG: single-stranded DNA-binding protein [Nocardioides sp.]